MKIKVIPLIIVLGISAILSYGIFSFCTSENATIMAIIGGLMSFLTLAATFGITINRQGKSVNIKVVSLIFFVLGLISNLIFAYVHCKIPTYIIVNGLIMLIWLLIVYGLSKAED